MVSEALTGKIKKSGAILMARGWNPLKPSYFFTFDKAQLIFFFFSIVAITFDVIPKKSLPNPRSWKFTPSGRVVVPTY